MKLYPYQQRVREAIAQGKSVILQAPTGAGKTLAALYPYFENLERAWDLPLADAAVLPLPVTCRYAVPMRVLASQFVREYRNHFRRLDESRGTRFIEQYKQLGIEPPTIETGESPEDPKFESPLTFCTIDQLLASFIGTPYSLSSSQANLNVGAVAGSYLILDEFHLYPLARGGGARTTTLAMLRMLKGLSPFVLMTATFSSRLLAELGSLLNAEVIRVEDDGELRAIMDGRQRTLHLSPESMSPAAILDAHEAARERGTGATLVICNTVARAQSMYQALKQAIQARGWHGGRLELLHARFTSGDRRAKSERLEEWLGKQSWQDGRFTGPDTIVVATQVVEVGLNISAGVLHTELAPASSIIQRAGRCARFTAQRGEVIVYPIPPRENGSISYRPYDEQLCQATWRHLDAQGAGTPMPFDFAAEQTLIDAVHTDEDQRLLQSFKESVHQIQASIATSLNTHDYGRVSQLIREAESVSVIIHDEPERDITTKPFTWEAFQLHPVILRGAWERMQQRRNGDWVLKQLVPLSDASDWKEEDNDREPLYTWDVLSHQTQIPRALRLALPTDLAAYDSEFGFRLLQGNDTNPGMWMSKPVEKPGKKSARHLVPTGKRRSYVEHISGLLHAYDWSIRRELAWIAARLERQLELSSGTVDEAVRLAIACHDIGKLADGWQRWAHDWQRLLEDRYSTHYRVEQDRSFLAKTDRLNSWSLEKSLRSDMRVSRPNHACASAVAGATMVAQHLIRRHSARTSEGAFTVARAILTAIAHHHAPTATTYDAASWDAPGVKETVAQALVVCRLPTDAGELTLHSLPAGELNDQWLLRASADSQQSLDATWLGFILVRTLRLCDQRADRDW